MSGGRPIEQKQVPGRTGQAQRLQVEVPRVTLRLQLLVDGVACEGVTCTVEGLEPKQTGEHGALELSVPAHQLRFTMKAQLPARKVALKLSQGEVEVLPARTRTLAFRMGSLADVELLQARLTNLGFHCDPIDGKVGPRTRNALLRFQEAFGLERSADPAHRPSLDKLQQLHGQQPGTWTRPYTDEEKLCRSLDPTYHVEAGERWNPVNVLEGPEVIVDAHMHVNSGKCSPLPLVWDKLPGRPRPSRETVTDLITPALGAVNVGLIGIRTVAKAKSKVWVALTVVGTRLTEAELAGLTTAVAKSLITAGYVRHSAGHAGASARRGAARLVDAAGKLWEIGSGIDRGVGNATGKLEQVLRDMVPEERQPSAEVMRNTTGFGGWLLGQVHDLYDKAREQGRRIANGATEAAADVAGATSRVLLSAADEEAGLAQIERAAAERMRKLADEADVSADRTLEDARRVVTFVAEVVKARIHEGGRVVRSTVETVDAKVTSAADFIANKRTFIKVGDKETAEIASIAATGNAKASGKIPRAANGGRLSMMMVMPMDMDFGHIDGYPTKKKDGEREPGRPIYEPVTQRLSEKIVVRALTFPRPVVMDGGFQPLQPDATDDRLGQFRQEIRVQGPAEAPTTYVYEYTVQRQPGPFYKYAEYTGALDAEGNMLKEQRWLPDSEFKMFQEYPRQVAHTLAAAARHPWTLLPLYHYDPRRWSEDVGVGKVTTMYGDKPLENFPRSWDEPLNQYFSDPKQRPFVGIKQYTALGYRPLDPRLPHQKAFYARCIKESIPIVCHCSPGGQYTLERPLFQVFEDRQAASRTADEREAWFSHHYVSPFAWEKALVDHPKLRLALAHFGGGDAADHTHWGKASAQPIDPDLLSRPSTDGMTWDDALIWLTNKYEHLYVDVSYFLFEGLRRDRFEKVVETYPHLRDKILFGTDWWMTEGDGLDYARYIANARAALQRMDPELWQRFSWINPVRFYRLRENAEAIAAALRASRGIKKDQAAAREEAIDRGLALLCSLEPGSDRAR